MPLLPEFARGVIPLAFCGTSCLTCRRCLLCLLASQTALTPPAKPLGKPGLHHSHLPLLHGRAMASQAGRLCSACWSRARDARQRQRTGTVQTSSVRPPCPVPAMCPMGRSPGVLRGYSRTRRPGRPRSAGEAHSTHSQADSPAVLARRVRSLSWLVQARRSGAGWKQGQ
jgi:hypothetical protein